jgi:hypothetical protein
VSEVLIRNNVVSKCLVMLQSAHTKMSGSGHPDGEGEEEDEEEDDFDYCFAWERPALRVVVGILKHLSSLPTTLNSTTTTANGCDGAAAATEHHQAGHHRDELPPLCRQVATVEMVQAMLNVLSIGGGGRGEVERLALDVLRRLVPITLSSKELTGTSSSSNKEEVATGAAADMDPTTKTTTSSSSTTTSSDINVEVKEITCSEYLLDESKRGNDLISCVRRVLVMSDEYTVIASLELLSKLSSLPSPSSSSSSSNAKEKAEKDTHKVWCDVILSSGLMPPIARSVISSRDCVSISQFDNSNDNNNTIVSTPFSTMKQHARPATVLMATSLLFRNILLSSNSNSSNSSKDGEEEGSKLWLKHVPGSMIEAAQAYLDTMVLLSTDVNLIIRSDAVASLITLIHPTAQHLSVYRVFIDHIKECNNYHGNTEESSSSSSKIVKVQHPTSMIGGALRTLALSGDLSINTRELAKELITIIDSALSQHSSYSSSLSSSSSSSNKSKNKKNKNKNKNKSSMGSGGGGGGLLGDIGENSNTLAKYLQNEIDGVYNGSSSSGNSSSDKQSDIESILALPNKLKQLGNDKFKLRLFADATLFYENVLTTLDDVRDDMNLGNQNGTSNNSNNNEEDEDEDDVDAVSRSEMEDVDVDESLLSQQVHPTPTNTKNAAVTINSSTEGNELHSQISALKVACYLNQARCYLKLLQEDKCLASCAYAEASTLSEVPLLCCCCYCCCCCCGCYCCCGGCYCCCCGCYCYCCCCGCYCCCCDVSNVFLTISFINSKQNVSYIYTTIFYRWNVQK